MIKMRERKRTGFLFAERKKKRLSLRSENWWVEGKVFKRKRCDQDETEKEREREGGRWV